MKLYVESKMSGKKVIGKFSSLESAAEFVELNDDDYEGDDFVAETEDGNFLYTDQWEAI